MEEEKAQSSKYDRQLRLWGHDGQAKLHTCKITFLGTFPCISETLKNLVLPGLGQFTLLSNTILTKQSLTNNFLCLSKNNQQNLDQSVKEGKLIVEALKEMNEECVGQWNDIDVKDVVENPNEWLNDAKVIVAAEMNEQQCIKIAKYCEENGKIFLHLFTTGMIGYLRVYGGNYQSEDASPPDIIRSDLRLNNPPKEILEYVSRFELKTTDIDMQSHIPFIVILIQLMDEWKKLHDNKIPQSFNDKMEFQKFIKNYAIDYIKEDNFAEAVRFAYQLYSNPSELNSSIENIFEELKNIKVDSNSPQFWIFCKALMRFYNENNCLPITGCIPDMAASTQAYLELKEIYTSLAQKDQQKMLAYINEIIDNKGSVIDDAQLKKFCKNSQYLEFIKYRSFNEECKQPAQFFYEEPHKWYFAIRGNMKFIERYNRAPKLGDEEELLNIINNEIISEQFKNCEKQEKAIADEMCRYENSHLHNISAVIGGVAAQEIVKVIANKFLPINNTFVYNGINCEAFVIEV